MSCIRVILTLRHSVPIARSTVELQFRLKVIQSIMHILKSGYEVAHLIRTSSALFHCFFFAGPIHGTQDDANEQIDNDERSQKHVGEEVHSGEWTDLLGISQILRKVFQGQQHKECQHGRPCIPPLVWKLLPEETPADYPVHKEDQDRQNRHTRDCWRGTGDGSYKDTSVR